MKALIESAQSTIDLYSTAKSVAVPFSGAFTPAYEVNGNTYPLNGEYPSKGGAIKAAQVVIDETINGAVNLIKALKKA